MSLPSLVTRVFASGVISKLKLHALLPQLMGDAVASPILAQSLDWLDNASRKPEMWSPIVAAVLGFAKEKGYDEDKIRSLWSTISSFIDLPVDLSPDDSFDDFARLVVQAVSSKVIRSDTVGTTAIIACPKCAHTFLV